MLLHLLPHGRPRVERADDGAEAARGADRREPGDAGADDQHLARRHLAGGGDLAGEEAAESAAPPR